MISDCNKDCSVNSSSLKNGEICDCKKCVQTHIDPSSLTIHMDDSRLPHSSAVTHSVTTQTIARDEDSHWRSCCLDTDRQAVVYLGQLSFAFAVLGFSGVMLYRANGSCEQSSPYVGLISFLLGKLLSSVTDSTRR